MSRLDAADRRTETRQELDILLNRFVEGHPYLCRAVDVSAQGMRIRAIHEPNRDETEIGPRFMGLQFQLPGTDDILTASGEAVFKDAERGELGVRFTRLPQATRDRIETFLQQNTQLD